MPLTKFGSGKCRGTERPFLFVGFLPCLSVALRAFVLWLTSSLDGFDDRPPLCRALGIGRHVLLFTPCLNAVSRGGKGRGAVRWYFCVSVCRSDCLVKEWRGVGYDGGRLSFLASCFLRQSMCRTRAGFSLGELIRVFRPHPHMIYEVHKTFIKDADSQIK